MTDTTIGFAPTEKMLDPSALAEMLRIGLRHLNDVRQTDPTFPQPRMLGTCPRWSPAAIQRWMDSPMSSSDASSTEEFRPATPAPAKRAKGTRRVH